MGFCVSSTAEQRTASVGLEQLPPVSDLSTAFAVEGSSVQDHLRLAVAGELLILDSIAKDGYDPALGLRPLVAQELRLAGPPQDGLVEIAELGQTGQIGFSALCDSAPSARP